MALTTGLNNFGLPKWTVSKTAGQGTHSTITTAMASASSGDTILLLPGTWTEDFTMIPGVNIYCYPTLSITTSGQTIIKGNITMSGSGICTIYGAELTTNGANGITVSGASSILVLDNCYLVGGSHAYISMSTGAIWLQYCRGNFNGGFAPWALTGGTLNIQDSLLDDGTIGTVAGTAITAGSYRFYNSSFANPISNTSSVTKSMIILNCTFSSDTTTGIVCGSGQVGNVIDGCYINSNSVAALSVSASTTCTLTRTTINSTLANPITGSGTIVYGDVTFSNTGVGVNTTTATPIAFPVQQGGTGASTLTGVLTGNGTSAVTASAVTQYALLVGGASNAVGSVADVATGQVLTSGGVSANPSFSAYPQVSGLGVGASPGSTAGITFDGSNFLNNYATGTFTPTLDGSVSGTTTYSAQNGTYTRIGNLVTVQGYVVISAATGTGNLTLGGLPFTIKNQTNGYALGNFFWQGGASWTWPTGSTNLSGVGIFNTTTMLVWGQGSAIGGGFQQMANAALAVGYTLTYQI